MQLFTSKQTKEAARSVLDELLRKENAASIALKAKETQLNQAELEYPVRIEAKKRELAEIEQRLQLAREKEQNEVFVLEERRKAALLPITIELKALQKTKDGIQEMLLRLDGEREEVRSAREAASKRVSEVDASIRNLEKMQSDTLSMLEQRRKEAETAVHIADITAVALVKEDKRVTELRIEVEKKLHGLVEAEHIAKGAMAAADKKIASIAREQAKLDDKRKMLKVAMDVIKKKEIWLKQQEKAIK